MRFDFQQIKKITPIAFQLGNLSGVRIIAKILLSNGEEYSSFLIPPEYQPFEKIPEYIIKSAIVKYNYIPLEDNIIIGSNEEFQKFIENISVSSRI